MKPELYSEWQTEVNGWPVRLTTYKLGETFHTRADNVSPGAAIARTTGLTKAEAEQAALQKARERLGRTVRHAG